MITNNAFKRSMNILGKKNWTQICIFFTCLDVRWGQNITLGIHLSVPNFYSPSLFLSFSLSSVFLFLFFLSLNYTDSQWNWDLLDFYRKSHPDFLVSFISQVLIYEFCHLFLSYSVIYATLSTSFLLDTIIPG